VEEAGVPGNTGTGMTSKIGFQLRFSNILK
jgi:hypothetical protein